MTPFEGIVDAIHGLSHEEKFRLRLLLDQDLKPSQLPKVSNSAAMEVDAKPRSGLIGLLADEPELADQILESAMTARETRPLRMPCE